MPIPWAIAARQLGVRQAPAEPMVAGFDSQPGLAVRTCAASGGKSYDKGESMSVTRRIRTIASALAVILGSSTAYGDGVCEKGYRDTTPAERATMTSVL